MTCKDCLCSDVCIETRDQIQMLAHQSRNDVEKVCSNFKDKSRFVELPCKVGDTVYKICPISNRLKIGDMWDGRKVKTDCDRCAWQNCDCHDIGYQKDCLNIVHPIKMKNEIDILRRKEYFGQIYFLTPEEAAEKLKEMK